jgi:hypothetical protein
MAKAAFKKKKKKKKKEKKSLMKKLVSGMLELYFCMVLKLRHFGK